MLGPLPRRAVFVGAFLSILAVLDASFAVAQQPTAPVVMGPDGKPMSPEQMKE